MLSCAVGHFDSNKDGQLSHDEIRDLLEQQLKTGQAQGLTMKDGTPYKSTEELYERASPTATLNGTLSPNPHDES